MNVRCWLTSPLLIAACLAAPGARPAWSADPWPHPKPSYSLDFKTDNPDMEIAFLDEGLAKEMKLDFLLVKHQKVKVQAKLPEPGKLLLIQTNPAFVGDVKTVRPGFFEVVSTVSSLNLDELTRQTQRSYDELGSPYKKERDAEAKKLTKDDLLDFFKEREIRPPRAKRPLDEIGTLREAYVGALLLDAMKPDLKKYLVDLDKKRPRWVTKKDSEKWDAAKSAGPLKDDYFRFRQLDILDEYLRTFGLTFDSDVAEFETELKSRAEAVYAAMEGNIKTSSDALAVSKILGTVDYNRLRTALTANLRCCFVPKVEPGDANAQWFNAQRVACKARGVASITVKGTLDPAANDRVDWWFVQWYDAAGTVLGAEKESGYRVDPPFTCEDGARLRIVASGKSPAVYTLTFRPIGAPQGDKKVVIYEAPSADGAQFPF